MFDPSWFHLDRSVIRERLLAQAAVKDDARLREATGAYLEFLDLGGIIYMEDVSPALVAHLLGARTPIITGLSATWLYQCQRERIADLESDDVAGEPVGHFVVAHGLDWASQQVTIADPFLHEPYPASHAYTVDINRLIGAILLGIVTFDAKLIVIQPAGADEGGQHVNPACGG